MVPAISQPSRDEHIAPCGLFCSNCRKFEQGRCAGCQVEAPFAGCPVRKCVVAKGLITCAECPDFPSGRDFRECPKLNNFLSKLMAVVFRSDRPGALAMLRDQGRDVYLQDKRTTKRI